MNNKKFEIVNYVFFSLVILATLVLTIVLHLNWLAFISCAASILYIVFLSERNILNFLIGFVSSATYIIIAQQSRLFGEVLFYLLFDIPMILVSFLMWRKHMETKYKVETKKLTIKNIIYIFILSAVMVVSYGFLLKMIGGQNTFLDALSTVVTLIATLLMAFRYREQWFMWIIVYIVSIILWVTTFNLLMIIMSSSCLLSSIIGYINWSFSSKKDKKDVNKTWHM